MKAFEYITAQSPASAVELAHENGRFIAGGTDLLAQMKEYIAQPERLVNVKALPDSHEVKLEKGICSIGTNVTIAQIAAHPVITENFPALAEAASEVGSPQIRTVGTLGGNLAQQSRCWYFRHRDIKCLKKGGSTCYARDGENKFHSLFSGNPCISPITSNLAIALMALNAVVVVQRPKEVARLNIPSLYKQAWTNPQAHNSLEPGELILGVEIPAAIPVKSAYMQMSEKSSFDWALVSCAAAAVVEGKKVKNVRVVLGAVAPVPHMVEAANKKLEGVELDDNMAATAAGIILKSAMPQEQNGYKVPISHALIRRTLLRLIA